MRVILFLGLLAMSFVLTGCETPTCDARGPVEFCELHHTYMHSETVSNKNLPLPSETYVRARYQLFIHSYPFFLPQECKKCMVYICDDCVTAEKQWKRDHPNGK